MEEMKYKYKREMTILDSGVYHNRKYFIISLGTHPCAYVEFNHEIQRDSDEWYDTPCYGGITFDDYAYWDENDETYYIGWDYAHFTDWVGYLSAEENIKEDRKKWTTKEILENVKEVIDYLNKFLKEEDKQ